MHRHGYQGRKLQLAAGPRKALIRGQITSLILHEAITTTEAKAKEVAPQFDRMVTYAKKGTLMGDRQLRRVVFTENAIQKMRQELAPQWSDRQGGYTRIIKLGNRRGDNAPMVRLALVMEPVAKAEVAPVKKTTTKATKAETTEKVEA